MMQALLLRKQTLEASYDPGPLLFRLLAMFATALC